jgi:sugar O-acyltransferase (sialic acid O-acetyltransferase NeuD family)
MVLTLLMQQQLNLLMGNSVTLFGASGHGKVIIDILKCSSISIDAVIDDNPKSEFIFEIPVVKTSNFDFNTIRNMIISIGNNKVRKTISSRLNVNYLNAIHPTAIISKDSKIGVGTVIMAGAIVNPDVTVGNHCIINTGAIVEHDCCIEDYSHISPGVSLAGNVSIGEGAHVGIGACVIQGVKIGKWSVVGAGAVVLNDIPDFATAVGNPARIIKYNQEN